MIYRLSAAGLLVATIAFTAAPARAECTCQCINGRRQPLCEKATDLPPVCPPLACAPGTTPTLPPPPISAPPSGGTALCRPVRSCDAAGNCRWQQVCR